MSAVTWKLDPSQSSIGFMVRHMVISKVRGRFRSWRGTITADQDFIQSQVEVTIEAASFDTGDRSRDVEVVGPNFLDVARYPEISFRSRRIQGDERRFRMSGDLTIHGVTREVTLDVRRERSGADRQSFSATTRINRSDWGLRWNAALEAGGVLVGETIEIEIDVSAVRC